LLISDADLYDPARQHDQVRGTVASTPDNRAKRAPAKKGPTKATKKNAPAKATSAASAKPRGRPRRPAPSHEAIAKRAYELYEAQGGGDHVAHWLQAERDVS
jgi:hypothetical protein